MRNLWIGLLVGVAAISLAACGSGDSDAESSANDQATTTTRAASTTPSDEYEHTTPSGKTVMVSRKQVAALKAWTAKMDPDGLLAPAEPCIDWETLAVLVDDEPMADGSFGGLETQRIAQVVQHDIAEPPCGVQVLLTTGPVGTAPIVFAAG